MNILVALILTANLALIGLILFAFLRIRAGLRAAHDFVVPPEAGQPSPLAQTAQALAEMAARSIVAQAKATFMGTQSGQARAEKAIEADIAEGALNLSYPMLGRILESFPGLKKTLRRNPGLVDMAIQKLAGRMGQQAQMFASPSGNGHGESPKFKL